MTEAAPSAPLFDRLDGIGRIPVGAMHQPPRRLRGPARWRLAVVASVLAAAFVAVGGKLILNAAPRAVSPAIASPMPDAGGREFQPRAAIVDRTGGILAYSLPFATLYANPQEVRDPAGAARALASILPGMNVDAATAALARKEWQGRRLEFAYLARHLTPSQHAAILDLGIPGLYFRKEYRRIYPRGSLAAHVVGAVQEDHRAGIGGIEAFFDADLASSPDLPLALSIDMRVQHVVHEELQNAIDRFSAIGGFAVMLDVTTGEVIASVSLPDFDPNRIATQTPENRMNKVAGGAYELGSMFKLLTAAAALDSGAATERSSFDASRPLQVRGHTISDFRGKNRWLTLPEVLIHSSNIGAARMADAMGTTTLVRYFDSFGLFQRAGVELHESTRPLIPARWTEVGAMTAAFGHGLSVTPMQFVAAVGAVANGGILHRPTLLKTPDGTKPAGTRVISAKTSDRMRGIMRAVVVDGSGKAANSRLYHVGGKTGTAQKTENGRYLEDKRLSSFVGVFPIEAPRYAIMVSVDEPKPRKDTFGYATGGWVAAPAVGKIVERVAPMLGIQKAPAEPKGAPAVLTVSARVGR
jgi:cell division protein FtsI (penicillin-binding protein 3)